ncbi:ABC transporter permease [Negativicoccus succinicivorans]|uniref:ABC transporter permease n=1 Tax=Negativicoccus succinicivorans TaxID=620903 RepID=UPI0029110C89|nr:ABC transporter permease [Negativicoccus succinicivorans]MDU5288419.1 ABC transporter permease [Negativicoccus succinicivorans]MDU6871788.1 ABC transporter permease [Negativicoccus succinicivorans]
MLRQIAWSELRHRPWQTLLLTLLIALAIASSVFIAALSFGMHYGLTKATEPFPQIVGAKGSANQLVLNTVYLKDRPIGNISGDLYQDVKNNPLVKQAIPLAFGDNWRGFRIVGTENTIFDYRVKPQSEPWLKVAEGRRFNAPFEAVIGDGAAKLLGAKIGDTFQSIHGATAHGHVHKDQTYTIVGILAPVEGPYDHAVLTDIRSVWIAHEHHHDHDHEHAADAHEEGHEHEHEAAVHEEEHEHEHEAAVHEEEHEHEHEAAVHEEEHEHEHEAAGKPAAQAVNDGEHAATAGQVTAVLIQPQGYGQALKLAMEFQQRNDAQLVFPAQVIIQLFSLMGQGEKMWWYIGAFFIAAALLVVLSTLYLSGLQRLPERAILRVLGAKRSELLTVTLWQNGLIMVLGGILGYVLGYAGYLGVRSLMATNTAIALPLTFLKEPLLIALGTMAIGLLASLIPAWLLARKDTLSKL